MFFEEVSAAEEPKRSKTAPKVFMFPFHSRSNLCHYEEERSTKHLPVFMYLVEQKERGVLTA
jgi:hypothetical protein